MLKISLGTKPAFFFCGSIAMSRKTNSYLSLDMSVLTDKEIQGLLRAHKTGAVVINEDLELLEKYTVKNSKEEPTEDVKQEIISEEEIQHGQETNEEGFQEITQEVLNDSSEELEVDKQVPVKQIRNTRKKS